MAAAISAGLRAVVSFGAPAKGAAFAGAVVLAERVEAVHFVWRAVGSQAG
jgi:hypothetical protein